MSKSKELFTEEREQDAHNVPQEEQEEQKPKMSLYDITLE